jgi:hypothetical protein
VWHAATGQGACQRDPLCALGAWGPMAAPGASSCLRPACKLVMLSWHGWNRASRHPLPLTHAPSRALPRCHIAPRHIAAKLESHIVTASRRHGVTASRRHGVTASRRASISRPWYASRRSRCATPPDPRRAPSPSRCWQWTRCREREGQEGRGDEGEERNEKG